MPGSVRASAPPTLAHVKARVWVSVTVLVTMAAMARPCASHAQNTYTNYLVGDRALGLAGAFVGLADDPSAAFHNPGGLAALPTSSLSGSLWAVAFESRRVESGYLTRFGGSDLTDSATRSLPFFAAGMIKLGPKDATGVREHALGVSVLQPYRSAFTFVAQREGMGASGMPAAARLEVQHDADSSWFGVSYGYRWMPGLSLGLSTFVAHTSMQHSETELSASEGSAAMLAEPVQQARAMRLDANVQHLVWRLGVLYDIDAHWRVGMMLQPPGVRLRGDGDVSQYRSVTDGSGTRITTARATGLGADTRLPWEARLGGSWYGSQALVTLDLSVLGPVPEDEDFVETVKGVAGREVYLPSEAARDTTLRGALGFELLVGEVFPMRGGLLFERSSVSATPEASETFVPNALNTYGLALSVGYRGNGYDVSFGATGTLGYGSGLALDRATDPSAPRFVSTDVQERTVFLFVSGGSRAAARFARQILRE